MGYHLWLDGDRAWAQGTYEYRALGAAVVARSDLFQRRDFSPRRRPPRGLEYLGQFASLGHINAQLRARRGAFSTAAPAASSSSSGPVSRPTR